MGRGGLIVVLHTPRLLVHTVTPQQLLKECRVLYVLAAGRGLQQEVCFVLSEHYRH